MLKTVSQLEDRLQVRLLIRSTHFVTPTDAGLRFYARARIAIQELDEAELEARGTGAGFNGRLQVSAATTFARLLIVPRLPEFLAFHPGLDIDLVSEGVDIALRMGDLADSTAVARKLATGARCVVATPAYLERAGTPKMPADLAHHHALVYSQLGDTWTFQRAKPRRP